jgi:hypothetical protein
MDKRTFEMRSQREQIDPEEVGWIRHSGARLESVTIQAQSEDALATDLYTFDLAGKVTRLVRTGGYINSPPASLIFVPDSKGRLRLDPKSREVLRRLDAAGYEHYIEDWRKYERFDQLPFGRLIDRSDGVHVRIGCAPKFR